MTIVPLWDVALAVAELNRTLAKGSKALCFVEDPGALGVGTWRDGIWDPLMQLCAETETPVCMHVGSAGSPTLDPGTTPIVEIAAAFAHTGRAAVNAMCSPVPRKFPDIKFVCFRFPMTVPADARLGI
jgi:predicted TIM-barrel fold metal-dependent hydrolase